MDNEHTAPCAALLVAENKISNLEAWQAKQNGTLGHVAEKQDTINSNIDGLRTLVEGHIAFHKGTEAAESNIKQVGRDDRTAAQLAVYKASVIVGVVVSVANIVVNHFWH